MLKKFVPLNSNASPSKNPYEIRTYMGDGASTAEWKVELCKNDRNCSVPDNSIISKVLTIEDELRRLNQKVKDSRFRRMFKKRCDRGDAFVECTVTQRTPWELKTHAVLREQYLKTQYDLRRRVHDATDLRSSCPSLVQLNSPIIIGVEEEDEQNAEEDGEEEEAPPVKPKMASPECSMDLIYEPPHRLLDLKRPKSGMYLNESLPPPLQADDDDIPYSTYNPRILQERLNQQQLPKIDIIEGRTPNDLWTWNIGLQKPASELTRTFIDATLQKLDCNKMELMLFKIPNDLEKTFTAGIVFGNEAVQPEPPRRKPSYYRRPMEVGCLFVAYIESFRFNPDFWTAETMDGILATSEKLIKKSTFLNYRSTDMDFDILPQLSEKQAMIGMKVHFTGPLENEPNIYKTLALYFSKFNAAVLCSKKLFMLIWKRCQNSFYVFDPNGRNELCHRDFETGKCSLIATSYVEHLVHLIVNFSVADMNDEFNLYEIFLINYGKILQPIQNKPFPKRTRRIWATVNDTFAIIPGANNGLHQPISGNEQNPSMVIALLSLLYGHIERAKLWRMDVVDELIKFGQAYYKAVVRKLKLKKSQVLNITDLPEIIMMGSFKATLNKRSFLYTGHVADCKSFLDSQLTLAMKELFSGTWEAALLQIDNSVIALWRDLELFYMFDPFRRGKAGQVLDPEDYLTKGVACLQMHTNFESFCRVLYQKAIKMRRGGKFFLHGVNVGCIKPLISAFHMKNRFTRLQLTFPHYTLEPEKVKLEKKPPKKGKGKGKLERSYSIQSIPEDQRIPTFDNTDVVESILEEVLCEVLHEMCEPMVLRPDLYKQVDAVLLRSDKNYLETLKYNVKHDQDYDNIYTAFQTYPDAPYRPMTYEEELRVPSNYETLPDGTWAIFGVTKLPELDAEMSKLSGLLAGLVTAALSAKYKISTWNSDLIEYAIESVNSFGEEFQNYEHTLTSIISKKIPKINIGQNTYYLKVQKVVKSSATRSLRQVLLESLINYNRLLVICQRFSCIIIKRYNFLYMFIGFPCNNVGYRKFGSGPGCMLRFVELDSLIRRIEFGCNAEGCQITNYVAVGLKVMDITSEPPERFRKFTNSDEEELYASEFERQSKLKQQKLDKIRFLDMELRKENDRIKYFLLEKQQRAEQRRRAALERCQKAKGRRQVTMEDGMYSEEEWLNEEEEEEEEEEEIPLKHKPGKRLQKEIIDKFKPRPILYGYRLREKDFMFKIQGSTALENRAASSVEEIKPCLFVSTLAILYAILRPLNQWNSQRIDRVIENGSNTASRVTNMTTAFERVIKNITVDDYVFDVLVKTFEPAGVWGSDVSRRISKATQNRRYLMLQISNGTYAIHRDEYYHLFDPYPSMDILQEIEEEEEEIEEDDDGKKKPKYPKGIKRYGERNTASWILFANVESMLKYIDKRAANLEWKQKSEFIFHVVDVLSYKKAGPRTRILQLLTDLSVPMDCKISKHGEDESVICAHNETIAWLDLENCLPVWSRMNRRNTAGRYRNLPVTRLKKYDVEIEGRLWSLWGNLHPMAPVFAQESRGKQYLACNVMACCAARVYRLADWSPQLLDTVVISGDKYHRDSLFNIKQQDYEFSLEDLSLECSLDNIKFVVHLEHVVYGKLYCQPTRSKMNLADALMYFFGHFQFGILQCHSRSLAVGRTFGHDGGYFMYDCQSRDHPLFPKGQGASYVLRTKFLQVLLYCIVATLNVPYFNVQFTLHKVEMLREGASVEDDEEEQTKDQ